MRPRRRALARARQPARTRDSCSGAAIAAHVAACATSSRSSPTVRTSSGSPTGPNSSSPSPPARRAPASCPSCSTSDSPELTADLPDVQVVRLVDDAGDQIFSRATRRDPRSPVASARSCSSGSTRPRSPDASSASTRSTSPTSSRRRSPRAGCSTLAPRPNAAAFVANGIEVRGTPEVIGARATSTSAIDVAARRAARERIPLGAGLCRPGRAPRARRGSATCSPRARVAPSRSAGPAIPALHRSVPQGRPRRRRVPADHRSRRSKISRSPSGPFTFGQLIAAQASGDASVLADHGRPVLTLTLDRSGRERRGTARRRRLTSKEDV